MVSNKAYRGDREKQLERKIKRRKRFKAGFLLGILIAIVIVAIAVFLYIRFFRYSSYEEKWEKEISKGSFVGCERYIDNVLKYSHDGVSYFNKAGDEIWVDSYEMKSPEAYVSGGYACISDVQGNQINIYDGSGLLGKCKTNLPVTKAVISESGTVAAIVEDIDASYINFYRKDGSSLDISIKTLLTGDGYPVDLALSPDGTQLIVALEYLDAGKLKGKVVFYNFSEIGKNIPNRLVAGFDEAFEDSLLADVKFINSTYSYAVADDGISFFSSKNLSSPELINTVEINSVIKTVFESDSHLGVVYENDIEDTQVAEEAYHLVLFKADGSVELEKYFSSDYQKIQTDDRFIYLIGNNRLEIVNMTGAQKYNGDLNVSPEIIVSETWPGRFVLSSRDSIREYQYK